jgi:protein disulfide-isomerase A6
MKPFTLSLLFLGLISLSFAKVIDLTPDNFDSIVDGSKGAFVEFFAPWCGHCKKLAPDYEIVGESFARENSVVIAKVDADEHRELGERFGVTGFPTLKFFPKGSTTPEDYSGGRSPEEIITYINNKVGTSVKLRKPASNVVDLTPSNFDSIVMNKDKDVLVEFYAPWCGHCKNLAPEYEKLANAYTADSHVVIAKVDADTHKTLGSRYGVTGFPTIKWFGKNNKETPVDYNKDRTLQSFVDFINENAGTRRAVNGRLNDEAGRIEALDAIAAKAVAKGADLADLLKQAEQIAKGLTGDEEKYGKIYTKIIQTIQTKGPSYIQTETERLERMLEGSVAAKKADEFTIRKNILEAFEESD